MLKVKDNVDLKELEKFGFKYVQELMHPQDTENRQYFETRYVIDFGNTTCEIVESRTLSVWHFPNKIREIYFYPNDYELFMGKDELNLIYDLIQAGLIEKVVE